MQDSRLVKLLKILDQEELKRLLKFLKSPYYNANPRAVRLYEYLRKDHPAYTSRRLNRERVFARLFPGRAFDYSTLANLMSDLSRLVEEYLVVRAYEQEPYERQRMLTRAFEQRNAYGFFEKKTKELLSELAEQPYRDQNYHHRMMETMQHYFFHPQTEKYKTGQADYPEQLMMLLDNYFMLGKLSLGLELRSREKALAKSYDIKWLEESVQAHENWTNSDRLQLFLYANLHRLFDGTDEGQFYRLKEKFLNHYTQIPETDQVLIFQQLLNYSVRQIYGGNNRFRQELFNLYREGLKLGCVYYNDLMDEGTFGNIVSIAGALEEFEWAAKFIEDYHHLLDEGIRENVKTLCYAGLSFQQNDFSATISYLQDYDFTMALHQVRARSLMIRCSYEQFLEDENAYEFLLAQLEAFEKFLRRNREVASDRRDGYLNFIKILRRLSDFKSRGRLQPAARLQLQDMLAGTSNIMLKRWLTDKIDTPIFNG